jgi:hypothetical protein
LLNNKRNPAIANNNNINSDSKAKTQRHRYRAFDQQEVVLQQATACVLSLYCGGT